MNNFSSSDLHRITSDQQIIDAHTRFPPSHNFGVRDRRDCLDPKGLDEYCVMNFRPNTDSSWVVSLPNSREASHRSRMTSSLPSSNLQSWGRAQRREAGRYGYRTSRAGSAMLLWKHAIYGQRCVQTPRSKSSKRSSLVAARMRITTLSFTHFRA